MSKGAPPLCETCEVKLTTGHIITECRKHEENRREHHIPEHVCQALGSDPQTCISLISFLKTIFIVIYDIKRPTYFILYIYIVRNISVLFFTV